MNPQRLMSQRLIAVDIGNSRTKLGWFAAQAAGLPLPEATLSFPTCGPLPDDLPAALPAGPCAWCVSSVQREGTRVVAEWVQSRRPSDTLRVLTHRDLPIETAVDFPEKVGLDRLAAAVAANVLRDPARPAIVIGAGSAITVNRIAASGTFEGGAILPGFKMQADALFGGADLLPLALLEPDRDAPPALGKNTEAAIRSGLFWGAVGAVRELTRQMAAELPTPPQVFVTGGDLRQLARHVDDARFVPHLVLSGIAASVGPR
jgi:type III pantothenate kinase